MLLILCHSCSLQTAPLRSPRRDNDWRQLSQARQVSLLQVNKPAVLVVRSDAHAAWDQSEILAVSAASTIVFQDKLGLPSESADFEFLPKILERVSYHGSHTFLKS